LATAGTVTAQSGAVVGLFRTAGSCAWRLLGAPAGEEAEGLLGLAAGFDGVGDEYQAGELEGFEGFFDHRDPAMVSMIGTRRIHD